MPVYDKDDFMHMQSVTNLNVLKHMTYLHYRIYMDKIKTLDLMWFYPVWTLHFGQYTNNLLCQSSEIIIGPAQQILILTVLTLLNLHCLKTQSMNVDNDSD